MKPNIGLVKSAGVQSVEFIVELIGNHREREPDADIAFCERLFNAGSA